MSANQPPLLPPGSDPSLPIPADANGYAVQGYDPAAYAAVAAPPPAPEGGGLNLARVGAAFGRYKWLIIALAAVGFGSGFLATRFLDPEYEVQATIYATPQHNEAAHVDPDDGPVEHVVSRPDPHSSYASHCLGPRAVPII